MFGMMFPAIRNRVPGLSDRRTYRIGIYEKKELVCNSCAFIPNAVLFNIYYGFV